MDITKEIDKIFLRKYISDGETLDISEMTKILKKEREKIINNHIKNVYPISRLSDGLFYTKLTPQNENHNGKITSSDEDVLKEKIVAYYVGLKTRDLTVFEVLEKVNEDYTKNHQEMTGKRHIQRFEKYFSDLRNVRISKLKKSDIETALHQLVDLELTRKEYVNTVGSLNRIADYCTAHELPIGCNIKQVVKDFGAYNLSGKHTFKQVKKRHRDMAFTEEEAKVLIRDALDNPSYCSLFVGLALTTGCRAGELLCMSYDNVDLKARYFTVEESEDKDGNVRPYIKENHAREVYLDGNAVRLIEALLELRGKDNVKSRYLFLNGDNKLHHGTVYKYLIKRQKELGFDATKKPKGLHDCRRTYASIAYLKGVKLQLISAQLGHCSTTQTWDYIKDIADVHTRATELEKGCIAI